MTKLASLEFSRETLRAYGLPEMAYPVRFAAIPDAVERAGELPFAELLYGLQVRGADGGEDWRALEPAMDRLAQMIAPADEREQVSASGDDWWLEIGPVDLDAMIVTLQRDDELLAAITPREDGRLRVAAFRPLDGKSLSSLIALGRVPHPEHGVCMRENNWEYALDCSAGMGQVYAADRGEAYLSFWQYGPGISADGTEVPEWRGQRGLQPRRPALVATELGVHYTLSADPAEDSGDPVRETQASLARFRGCLLGGAVGDALGAPVEFLSRGEILARFGPSGITSCAPAYGRRGAITDDTQMSLFTAEGLLQGWIRGCLKGGTDFASMTSVAYLRWLRTQGVESRIRDPDLCLDGALYQQRALHSRRAPGNTCLSALQEMAAFGDRARNDSKGCGGVMRVAPAGLFGWSAREHFQEADVFALGTDLAALTHGHPTGSLTAGVLAVLVRALVDGMGLPEALRRAEGHLREYPSHEETLRALEQAEALAEGNLPQAEAIARLGEGWIAEEALAISVYAALVADSFADGVILAVNHDGDSDSTGAIAGHLLGCIHGVDAIPTEWLDSLELRETIDGIAYDLHAFPGWQLDPHATPDQESRAILEKYPPH